MPRQGKKRAAPDSAETPEAKRAREEVDSGYRLQCKAALFTWNCQKQVSAQEALEAIKTLSHWQLVMWYTICAEEGSHWHIHAYFEFSKTVDHAADGWKLWDIAPNIQTNKTKSNGFSTAVRRGSFYVANEYKKSFRSHTMNFVPGENYSVKTQWIIDQWSQDKIRDPVECAGKYRCLTPSFKAMVTMSQGQISDIDRQEYHLQRGMALAAKRKTFKVFEEIVRFTDQFKEDEERYKFLWIWGESCLGKTTLAKNVSNKVWHHRNSIDWAEYKPTDSDAILFDDCPNIEEYIMNHKMLFMAGEITTVNTSRTNCYALRVDSVGKMIMVCANHPPCNPWTVHNSMVLHVTEQTWVS